MWTYGYLYSEIFCSCRLESIWFLNSGALVQCDAGCWAQVRAACVCGGVRGWGGWVSGSSLEKTCTLSLGWRLLPLGNWESAKWAWFILAGGLNTSDVATFMWIDKKAILKISRIWVSGTSLVAQWLRICLPMQGTWVWAPVWEDPTCRGATKPVRHNYWACALEPASHNYWARTLQLLKPARLEPVLRNKRSHRNEKPAHCNEE